MFECKIGLETLYFTIENAPGLRPRTQEILSKQYCMSLRTAMVRFFTYRTSDSKCFFRSYRTSDSKCFFRSYVFADCGHEDKRKSKSNIVFLCGLQWLCLLSVGDLKVNVSSGRMSLRTALPELPEWICWPPRGVCCELPYVFAVCFN